VAAILPHRNSGRLLMSAFEQHVIEIVTRHQRLSVNEDALRQAAITTLTAENVAAGHISLVLTDDAEIHRINREFLGHDYPTDVITFTLSDEPTDHADQPVRLEGELIISLDTAERVATRQGWSLDAETVLYVVHGTLHLCGYDDLSDETRPVMRIREREILSRLNLAADDNPTSAGWDDGPA